MKKYRVLISGENLQLQLEQKIERCGFYTTRYIEAISEEEAEVAAITLVQSDEELRDMALNEFEDPPRVFVDGVEELESFDGLELPGSGYTFFVDDGA